MCYLWIVFLILKTAVCTSAEVIFSSTAVLLRPQHIPWMRRCRADVQRNALPVCSNAQGQHLELCSVAAEPACVCTSATHPCLAKPGSRSYGLCCFTCGSCKLIPAWEVLGVHVNAEQMFFTPSSLVSSLCLNISYNSTRMASLLHCTVPSKMGVIPQQIAECAYALYDNQDDVTLMGL